ncbi:DUF2911 domain-containing protein [Chitinophaga deserti]|uniref:DUF2911 domain-containing protein n=1 Tax=Chitinophaga deserti TaxID=2164099 RepID=UPI000D6AE801|nr:DUF2911 domain-containing protein [Chitinophaga deserti]
MKQLSAFLTAAAFGVMSVTAQAQVKMPAPSPGQTIKQDFALSAVEVTYSRPAVKGRTIMGDLVPYNKIWRMGANAATRIKFGEDVKLNGKPVPAGEYVIYAIPGHTSWEIIINKGLKNWGVDGYKQEEDVARFTAEPQELPFPIESFMITFGDVRPSAMTMMFLWDRIMIPVEITADIDGKIMASIEEGMKTDKKPYFQAAMYYFESGRDVNQAIKWMDAALAEPNNAKAFWMYYQKARMQAKAGDKAGAKATSAKSTELAKAAKNDDYVALNEKLMATL